MNACIWTKVLDLFLHFILWLTLPCFALLYFGLVWFCLVYLVVLCLDSSSVCFCCLLVAGWLSLPKIQSTKRDTLILWVFGRFCICVSVSVCVYSCAGCSVVLWNITTKGMNTCKYSCWFYMYDIRCVQSTKYTIWSWRTLIKKNTNECRWYIMLHKCYTGRHMQYSVQSTVYACTNILI